MTDDVLFVQLDSQAQFDVTLRVQNQTGKGRPAYWVRIQSGPGLTRDEAARLAQARVLEHVARL